MQPLISILLPTYEPRPAHLRAALEAVLAQTEQRWRLCIHDDFSETDVRAIVEPYLRDPRITFKRNPVRLGIGGNWNACLSSVAMRRRATEGLTVASDGAKSDSPFIQFLFQDDLWDPTYLASASALLEKYPDIGFVASDHRYIFDDPNAVEAPAYQSVREARKDMRSGRHAGKEFLRQWIERELHPNLIGEPSFVMLRQSLMEKVGPFSEDMPQFLDVDYWLRCLLYNDFIWIAEECGAFRVHGKAASARNEVTGEGIADRLQCFERLIAMLPQGELRNAAAASRNGALTGMARKFLKRLREGRKSKGARENALWLFALKHPLLCIKALLRAI